MELPRLRAYEGPPARVYAEISLVDLDDSDFHAADVSPYERLQYEYGPQGANWDIVPRQDKPALFDAVVYPDGQAYNASRNAV